jgi:hypothetical protein
VYMDNGKSFKNKFFTESWIWERIGGLFSRMKPLDLKLAFAHRNNHVRRKLSECVRDFGEIERQLPTYCGLNIENKPTAWKKWRLA